MILLVFYRQNMTASKNKSQPPLQLSAADLRLRPPLELEWLGVQAAPGPVVADARILLTWPGRRESKTFVAAYRPRWTAAALQSATVQARKVAQESPGDLPLVVLPYLSSEMLDTLAQEGVSGLDLVGNACVCVGDWLLLLDGRPNRFKNPQVVKSPYQGKSALVAHTLLSCSVLPTAEALRAEVAQRGGEVSQPVVSRALKALRDELIVGEQDQFGVVLLQPEKLLDRLQAQWRATTERWQKERKSVLWRGRITGDASQARRELFRSAREQGIRVVRRDAGPDAQVPVAGSGAVSLYAERLGDLLGAVGAEETARFPNLEILLPPDDVVFFDAAESKDERFLSPAQLYLELAVGDARAAQAAGALREEILDTVARAKAVQFGAGGQG